MHVYTHTHIFMLILVIVVIYLLVFANIRIAQLLSQVALSENAVISEWEMFNYLQLHQISNSVFDRHETCLTVLVSAIQKLLPFGFLKFLLWEMKGIWKVKIYWEFRLLLVELNEFNRVIYFAIWHIYHEFLHWQFDCDWKSMPS